MERKLIITSDGSPSIYLEKMKETYHSVHGALRESLHVFINAGLKAVTGEEVRILEVGLGTGLNAWLTFMDDESSSKQIAYTALEPYPLEEELIENLISQETFKNDRETFRLIHCDAWDKAISLRSNFEFKKTKERLEHFVTQEKFDLIYMDAFAPSKQAEIWSLENITKLYNLLNYKGILVSYCASGSYKRNLKTVGFEVESLPGPPGKIEMTRARKSVADF